LPYGRASRLPDTPVSTSIASLQRLLASQCVAYTKKRWPTKYSLSLSVDALIALACREREIPAIASFDADFDQVAWLKRVAAPEDVCADS
jgi:predicted nucleic acid-binding protein